jgi:hypothetical protein
MGLKKGQGQRARLGNFETNKRAKMGHQEVNGLQTGPGGASAFQDTPPRLFSTSSVRCRLFSHGSSRIDLKPNIKKGPLVIPEAHQRGYKKQRNREKEGCH